MYVDSVLTIVADVSVDSSLMHEPAYYSPFWAFVGFIFIAIFFTTLTIVFYVTRRKPAKPFAKQVPRPMTPSEISELRNKYLSLIQETELRFHSHKIKASVAHQELSILVRLFYMEACGFHAESLTLNDLRHYNKPKLISVIADFYPSEFNGLENGSVAKALDQARALIMDDEALASISGAISIDGNSKVVNGSKVR